MENRPTRINYVYGSLRSCLPVPVAIGNSLVVKYYYGTFLDPEMLGFVIDF